LPDHGHAVQFYEDEDFLLDTVVGFLRTGLEVGDRLLVVADEEHRERIRAALAPCLNEHPLGDDALVMLDAAETLARFMVGETLDKARFDAFLSGCLSLLTSDGKAPKIRAYGEMVNLLWRRGNPKAAIRLEELWNEVRKVHPFALLCGYALSAPLASSDAGDFASVCDNHDLVLPTERFFRHASRAAELREVSILQHRARSHSAERARRLELEQAVSAATQALHRFEDKLAQSTLREREVRAKAEADDAFEELFLGILKNDLRKPLRAILETAQALSSEGLRRDKDAPLRHLVSTTRHIERMVAQLVDVTRVRSAGGLDVVPSDGRDVVPVVAKVVDEASRTSPEYTVVLHAPSTCVLRVDVARFEEVIANLVSNAVVHGDPAWPVNVTIAPLGAEVSISVQNCGEPIAPEVRAMLFSPFARGARPRRGPAGLGLGLYLSELIVTALGGRIDVESTQGGTLFEVILPR
jgi:signal transduction histidine kinase